MAENTDAIQPPQQPIKPNPFAEALTYVPDEYKKEFSTGELIVGQGIKISGENEERKLHIDITPEDPEYKDCKDKISNPAQIIRKFNQGTNNESPENADMRESANSLEAEAELLVRGHDPNRFHSDADIALRHFLSDLRRLEKESAEQRNKLFSEAVGLDSMKQTLISSSALDKLSRTLIEGQKPKLLEPFNPSDPNKPKADNDYLKYSARLNFCINLLKRNAVVYSLKEPQPKV